VTSKILYRRRRRSRRPRNRFNNSYALREFRNTVISSFINPIG
jgi:hypothetical protein